MLWCLSILGEGRDMVRVINVLIHASKYPMLWIRIRLFLGLPDPDPSIFCTDPDPSINKQKSYKILDFYCFVTFLFYFFIL
jgi:hypothetical protein